MKNLKIRKQSSRGVSRKSCSENMQQIYRRIPMPKHDFNTLWHGCSCIYIYTYNCNCIYIHIYIYIYINFVCQVLMSEYIYKKLRHLFTKKLYFGFFQTFKDSIQ